MKTSIFNKSILFSLLSFFLVCLAFSLQTTAAFAQNKDKPDTLPLHVISDKMIAQKDTSMIEFIGNVKATRADTIVFADSIKVYFTDGNKGNDAQSNIKKIVATGNVRYSAGEQKAFADKAVYTAKEDMMVLTGQSPKLITGSSFVTGKKITLFRKQDKVIVESDGTKRVELLFNPEDNITEKQK